MQGHFTPTCDDVAGLVQFNNVSFSYPSREDTLALKNIDFTAKCGEVVALVGASGGGKSSILSLLERFYEPNAGEILLDGVDIGQYEHHFFHRTLSIVQQEPVMFARKIRNNIMYGFQNDAITDDDIKHAAELANAHLFISGEKLYDI